MNDKSGSLSDADVRRIALLVETLDRSSFDSLQLDTGDFRLTLGRGTGALAPGWTDKAGRVPQAGPGAGPPRAAASSRAPAPPEGPLQNPKLEPRPHAAMPADGTVDIPAPLRGMFYSRPDPASPPFVTVGSEVGETTTVGLIEVMKVFNAVSSGTAGIIAQICAEDGALVDIGQPLFRVRPPGTAG